MAARKQSKQKAQKETGEAREQTKAEKDSCLGCDLDCTTCEVNGAKTLRRAACQTLRQESKKITTSLATKAKKGDANSTKLLLLLSESEQAKEGVKKSKRGRKMAQALAEEPEWSEKETEALAKTETGSRALED